MDVCLVNQASHANSQSGHLQGDPDADNGHCFSECLVAPLKTCASLRLSATELPARNIHGLLPGEKQAHFKLRSSKSATAGRH